MMKCAILAGIPTSIINSLICGTPFLTAFVFYLVYKERISKIHFLGMMLLLSSTILISAGPKNSVENEKLFVAGEKKMPAYVPVLLALFLCLLYAL